MRSLSTHVDGREVDPMTHLTEGRNTVKSIQCKEKNTEINWEPVRNVCMHKYMSKEVHFRTNDLINKMENID